MVKTLKLQFSTAREQAEYYFNRDMQCVPLELIEDPETGGIFEKIMQPSTNNIVRDYLDAYGNEDELHAEYLEEESDLDFEDWVAEQSEFEDYYWGDWSSNHYPRWGTVFACPSFYVDSDCMDVDKLYNLGIGVIDHETGYYLFIAGAGYGFYDAHWIPLFKELGWIEELKNDSDEVQS